MPLNFIVRPNVPLVNASDAFAQKFKREFLADDYATCSSSENGDRLRIRGLFYEHKEASV
jgi:hypothetical protein